MKSVAGTLRLDLAQYRELAAFAQFGSDLDKASQQQLNRGKRWVEVLKQGPYSPIPVEKQVALIFAGNNGFLDDLPVEDVRRFEGELYQFLDNSKPEILKTIREKRELNDEAKRQLTDAIKELKGRFNSSVKQSPARQAGSNGARPAGNGNRSGSEQAATEARPAQSKA
jgi:F-type H+-transporting ATPase subunit alpha